MEVFYGKEVAPSAEPDDSACRAFIWLRSYLPSFTHLYRSHRLLAARVQNGLQ